MPLDWNDEQIDAELVRQGYDPEDFKWVLKKLSFLVPQAYLMAN